MSTNEQYAKDRQEIAQRSVNEKLKCNIQQIKDITLTKCTGLLNNVVSDIELLSNVEDTISNNFNINFSETMTSALSIIDNTLNNVSGLLGTILKETAMSEKLNEIHSEVVGLVTQSQTVTRGLEKKVKELKSINDLIRYDNFSNTAGRIDGKNTTYKDNTSILFKASISGDLLLGLANNLLSLINNGMSQLGITFPSFSQFPKYNLDNFISPLPQISCPKLPQIKKPLDDKKNDERTTVHAIKCVKNGTKQSNEKLISDLIKGIGETINLAENFCSAINNIGCTISKIEESVPKYLFDECYNICNTFEDMNLECEYTVNDIDKLLSEYGINREYGFSFGSNLSSRYDLDKINPSLQTSLTNISNLYTYANTNLNSITNKTPSVDAPVGIPNDTNELLKWLDIQQEPITTVQSNNNYKSTIEPVI